MIVTSYYLVLSFIVLIFQDGVHVHGRQGKAEEETNNTTTLTTILSKHHKENQSLNIASRIVGGELAPRDAYPWFAIITNREGTQWQGCGGMLIASNYVLTAAHCITSYSSSSSSSSSPQISVLIGAYCFYSSDNCGQKRQLVRVSSIIAHPGYDGNTFDNDYALLKLSSSVEDITPVLMDQGQYVDNYHMGKRNLYAIGFGSQYYSEGTETKLRHVELAFVPRSICNRNFFRGSITDSMMCATDPGGPLYDRDNDVLVGVVSWGKGCGVSYPGVYAQISTISYSWIMKNICDGNDKPIFICAGSESPYQTLSPSTKPTWTKRPSAAPSISSATTRSCIENNQYDLRIYFTTDMFPTENYWTVQGLNGTLFRSNGPFVEGGTYNSKICFETWKCYNFTFYDSYGDGLLESARFEVSMNGIVVLSNPNSPFSVLNILLGDERPSISPSLSIPPSFEPSLSPSLHPTLSTIPSSLHSAMPSFAPTMDCSDDQVNLRISISANYSIADWKVYHVHNDYTESLLQEKVLSSAESISYNNKSCLDQSEDQWYLFQLWFENFNTKSRQDFEIKFFF